jgi:hypothetical protein
MTPGCFTLATSRTANLRAEALQNSVLPGPDRAEDGSAASRDLAYLVQPITICFPAAPRQLTS